MPSLNRNHEFEKEDTSTTLRGDSEVVELLDPQESRNKDQTGDLAEGEQQHTAELLHAEDGGSPIKELTKEELTELYLGAKRNKGKSATGDEGEEVTGSEEEEEPAAKRMLVGLPQDDDDDDVESYTNKATNEKATSNFRSTLLFSRTKDVPGEEGGGKPSSTFTTSTTLPATSLRSNRSATTAAVSSSVYSSSSLTSNGLRSLAPPSSSMGSQRGARDALSDATTTSVPMPMAPPPVIAPVFRRAGAPVALSSPTTSAE